MSIVKPAAILLIICAIVSGILGYVLLIIFLPKEVDEEDL